MDRQNLQSKNSQGGNKPGISGLNLGDFERMSLDDRAGFYRQLQPRTDLLSITTKDRIYDHFQRHNTLATANATAGGRYVKSTERPEWLTRDARKSYLSDNFFRIAGTLLPQFLAPSNHTFQNPDGVSGVDPKQHVQRLNIVFRPEEIGRYDPWGAAPDFLSETIALLRLCGRQLATVVLELQWNSQEQLHGIQILLDGSQGELRALDRHLQVGLLIVEYGVGSMGVLERKVIPLPWWEDDREKQEKMERAGQEWRARLRETRPADLV